MALFPLARWEAADLGSATLAKQLVGQRLLVPVRRVSR